MRTTGDLIEAIDQHEAAQTASSRAELAASLVRALTSARSLTHGAGLTSEYALDAGRLELANFETARVVVQRFANDLSSLPHLYSLQESDSPHVTAAEAALRTTAREALARACVVADRLAADFTGAGASELHRHLLSAATTVRRLEPMGSRYLVYEQVARKVGAAECVAGVVRGLAALETTTSDASPASEAEVSTLLARKVEALVRELRLRVVENDELRQWIEYLELDRSRLRAANEMLWQQVGALRYYVTELEGYADVLESQRRQLELAPERLRPVVEATRMTAKWFADYSANVAAAATIAGTGILIGNSTPTDAEPPPVVIHQVLVARCDDIMNTLDQTNA